MFVARRFPPSVGGMETLAADVWEALVARFPDATLVAHRGSNRGFAQFLLRAWWQILRATFTKRCDVVIISDVTTYLMVWPLLVVLRRPTVTMAMGLDLTYPSRLYRAAVRFMVPRAKHVLAISNSTADVARSVGVPADRVSVVRLGVAPPTAASTDKIDAARALRTRWQLPDDAPVVLTLGRLVARKGVAWFVTEVMPKLADAVHYVVAGSGPEHDAIVTAATNAGATDRVHLLGRVDDEARELLLCGADLFVQPNVPIPGDMEGFGLVVVEAALRGTPVVASALEGLQEAVVEGETGILCPPGDAESWRTTVTRLLDDRDALRAMGERFRARASELNDLDPLADSIAEALMNAAVS
jgi:phosphatidylinositol alpha-1,6-mannosyltransferase